MTVGYKRPWAHLLMTRDEIKQAIVDSGRCINEVDSILDSLLIISALTHHAVCANEKRGKELKEELVDIYGTPASTPFDWISVIPTSVSVENIEAVRVGLRRNCRQARYAREVPAAEAEPRNLRRCRLDTIKGTEERLTKTTS